MIKNPIMFVLEIVTALTTYHASPRSGQHHAGISLSTFQIILWLWFTVLFANFAEAIAEGRGKAQAGYIAPQPHRDARRRSFRIRNSAASYKARRERLICEAGDLVLVEAGDFVPWTAT